MELILILGLGLSALGASAYAVAYEHQQRTKHVVPTFKRIGKDGFGKHNNYR